MIEKNISLNYNLNINSVFDYLINNNIDLIKSIDYIIQYKKGIWDNNKRTDIYSIKLNNIPDELKSIVSLFSKNNIFNIKLKLYIININDMCITLKSKINFINPFLNIIFKLIKIKFNIIFLSNNNNHTNINIIYFIKSKFSNKISTIINNYIDNFIKPHLIDKINIYLNNL